MDLNEIILMIIGAAAIGGTLYMMIRVIFLPNPSSKAQQKSEAEKKPGKTKA